MKLIPGLIVMSIFAVVVGISFYQTNTSKPQSELRVGATDPCAAYTKSGAVSTGTGIVHDKTDNGFNWWENGQLTKSKAVVICSGAKVVREFGGSITYAEVKEGDKVTVSGFYGNTAKSTILAKLVTDMSTEKVIELNATVKSVDSNGTLTLNPVNVLIAGKTGQYELIVTHDSATKCFTSTLNKPIDCLFGSTVVKQKVAVTGVLSDNTLTLAAIQIVVDPIRPANLTITPRPTRVR